jgi:hypothetical protein
LLVGLSLCPAGGCRWVMDTNLDKTPVQAPPLKVTATVAPVQPEELTPSNARSKAKQLLQEIEQDEGKE